jgi:O-antigen/teichoic acid export membrane protein
MSSFLDRNAVFRRALASGVFAQIVSNVSNIAYVPLALGLLGSTEFGLWMVIMSVLMYMGLSQFGLGSATAALTAQSATLGEQSAIFYASVRYLVMAGLALLLLGLLAAALRDHWIGIFGQVSSDALNEAVLAVGIMAIFFIVRLPSVAVSSTFIGLQEFHWERLYSAILPPLVALFAVLMVRVSGGGLVELSMWTGGGQFAVGLLSAAHLFIRYPHLRAAFKRVESSGFQRQNLLVSGGKFFAISLAATAVWGSDNLVIGYFLGPEAVTSYAVTFKLFTAAYAIFIVINSALWPMFGKAYASRDWLWMNEAYNRALWVMPVMGGAVWLGGTLFARPIIDLWTGSDGYGGPLVVFALGAYGFVLALVNTHATFLSGTNHTGGMLWIGPLEALLNLLLSIVLIGWLGIGGVALGTALAALLTAFWLLPMDIKRRTQGMVQMSWWALLRITLVTICCLPLAFWVSKKDFGMVYFIQAFGILLLYLTLCWWASGKSRRADFLQLLRRSTL